MIMRVFQVSIFPDKVAEFSTFFHETAIPLMTTTDGIVSVQFGTPQPDSPTEFCIVMIWRDLAALKAFAGEDYQNPHILPEEAELVRARTITHYDLVEV